MTDDLHAPTNAGPPPDDATRASWRPPESSPAPAYGHADPAGSGLLSSAATGGFEAGGERPELLVGGAFAAGLLTAMLLKRLGN
jgi:hypothetical protein